MNEDSSTLCSDQNFLCIWCHDDDINKDVQLELHNRLKRLFTHFHIFNQPKQFAAYLRRSLIVRKIFFIVTGKDAQSLCAISKNRPQYEKVYVFQPTSSLGNPSVVFNDINQLFMKISEDIQTSLNNNQSSSNVKSSSTIYHESRLPPPWSVWSSKIKENSFQYWRKESPEFFLFQALSKILISMQCDNDRSFKEMIKACRLDYINNLIEVQKVDDVEKSYKAKDAILHYTNDSFLFRSVGKAFRSEDFENIFIFRRYIIDLHSELDKLVKRSAIKDNTLRLYRGKKLGTTVLQQLQDNIGALISMNGFLSTTRSRQTAIEWFAGSGQDRPDYESVVFEFCIDKITMLRTYADISSVSQFPSEEEVLFSIGSVWQIDSIQKNGDSWWNVKLSCCNEVDSRIVQFFEELPYYSTLHMIGDVLLELGQYTKAENFYYKMLDEPSLDNETRFTLYNKIAVVYMEQGKYRAALENFSKAEKLISTKLINLESLVLQSLYSHSIVTSRMHLFNNMALSYEKIGDSDNALEYLRKALKIEDEVEPIYKAKVYDNIGLIFFSEGQYDKAFESFSESVRLAQDHSSLPEYKQHCQAAQERLNSRSTYFNKQLDDSS